MYNLGWSATRSTESLTVAVRDLMVLRNLHNRMCWRGPVLQSLNLTDGWRCFWPPSLVNTANVALPHLLFRALGIPVCDKTRRVVCM